MTTRNGRRAGFTLIELLVVVVIIGILASVAMPGFAAAQDRARNANALGSLGVVRAALEQYAADNNGLYPLNADFAGANGLGQHNYLPGNQLPKSPWSPGRQSTRIQTQLYPAMCAEWLNDPVAYPRPKFGATFSPALAGSVGLPAPTVMTHFGAIVSDCEDVGDRTNYVINVIGKKGKHCIVAGWVSNTGGP